VSLFIRAESVAHAFNMILSEWCTVTSQRQDCSPGIWWTVNDVFLAGVTDVCEDQVVDCCTSAWMKIADLFWPEVKNVSCPW
jgi:hypothetical protein